MNILEKGKETLFSVFPIIIIVLVLGCTVAPLGSSMIIDFLIGSLLLILGLTLFLLGVDLGILPIGEAVGAALVKKRNLALLLGVSFITGFIVTAAEPDVQVLANQISTVSSSVNQTHLVLMISAGIGLFVMLGLLRSAISLPLNFVLLISYVAVFALAYFTPPEFLAVAFDSGGATTGPMTVPFIMALGVGVAAVRGKDNESFGLTGIASVGPIMAVLLYGIISSGNSQEVSATVVATEQVLQNTSAFFHLIPEVLVEVTKALLPLVVLFFIFQITLVKMPPHKVAQMVKGLIYSFIGLVLFLMGVKGGFMPAGTKLGELLGELNMNTQGFNVYSLLLVGVGAILGAVVVCAEPAVWVLTDQVEQVSGGTVKRKMLLSALSMGVAFSIALSMVRVIVGFSIWWYIIPGYALALGLTFFCPKMFTAIAFDSGGVASGPMTSTFILAFTLGVSAACGGNPITDAFGVIALVAMIPLIAIQLVGIIYRKKINNLGDSL